MSRAWVPWQLFQQHNGNEVTTRIDMDDLLVLIWTWLRTWHRPSSNAGRYYTYFMFLRLLLYFPMQKSLKIMSRISSAPTRPVIRPRLVRASRTPSAARARSMSRYHWYWARAAQHCCRWALWRAWVKLGAPTRGSAQLEEIWEKNDNVWECMTLGSSATSFECRWLTDFWRCCATLWGSPAARHQCDRRLDKQEGVQRPVPAPCPGSASEPEATGQFYSARGEHGLQETLWKQEWNRGDTVNTDIFGTLGQTVLQPMTLMSMRHRLMHDKAFHTCLRLLLEGQDTLQVVLEEFCRLWCIRGELSTVNNHQSQISLLQSEKESDSH